MWKTLFFRREKKMWKNPIFQERKKNVKKPYFSGEKKKCEKTLFFRREKKNLKKPYFSGGEKKKKKSVHEKKIFGHFLVLKKKVYILKIFSPEILSIFFFVHEKIFGRKILSIWKNLMYKKKSFFPRVFANFLAFFTQKKKKTIFFFRGPKILKKPAKNLPSDQRITTFAGFLNISAIFGKYSLSEKKFL